MLTWKSSRFAFAILTLSTGFAAAAPAQVVSNFAAEQAFAAATGITKQAATAIALKAVGGGTVIQAVYEKQDRIPHWSIDIVKAPFEYEVWVNGSGQVIRTITQRM